MEKNEEIFASCIVKILNPSMTDQSCYNLMPKLEIVFKIYKFSFRFFVIRISNKNGRS